MNDLPAGYETSGHTLAFCLWHLALNPDIQSRLREEILEAYQGWLIHISTEGLV